MNLTLVQELHKQFDPTPTEVIKQLRNIDFEGVVNAYQYDINRENALKEAIQTKLGNNFNNALNLQQDVDVVLLFIDMCSFSTRFGHLSNSQLSALLDQYYQTVITIIYKHNGEIDKIIGDGIIAVFGKPFLNLTGTQLFDKAEDCAKALITATKGTQFKSKIALHDGTIMYYRNKSVHYPEYTIIGKPITELHRLESIANDEAINFYFSSKYGSHTGSKYHIYPWSLTNLQNIAPPLKGVSHTYKRCLEKS